MAVGARVWLIFTIELEYITYIEMLEILLVPSPFTVLIPADFQSKHDTSYYHFQIYTPYDLEKKPSFSND